MSKLTGFSLTIFTILIWGSLTIAGTHGQDQVSGPRLSVDDFLNQVRRSNEGYRSMKADSQGATATALGAQLLFKPQAFTKIEYVRDTRTNPAPSIQGERVIQRNYSVGLRQQTTFGLQLQLSFESNQNSLIHTDPAFVTNPNVVNYYPVPVFRLSLWENFLGREDRATFRLQEAQSLATAFGKSYEAQATLIEAEGRYWRLAFVREAIHLQKESVTRARRLLELNRRKQLQHLIDDADALLGEAAVQGKELELESLFDEEKSAARALNSARGVDSNEVPETLSIPIPQVLQSLDLPARKGHRGDVKIAQQKVIAASAGNEIAREKLLPSLNVYGSIFAYGVALSFPIDQGLVRSAREGYFKQTEAAELAYQRKIFEEDNDWKELTRKFKTTQKRLSLALKLEDIQRRKFESLNQRRERGLTISFQVFQYELDYLSAALTRVQIAGALLGLNAQMKLYGEGS